MIASIGGENMLGLSADIICSENRTVLREGSDSVYRLRMDSSGP